MPPNSEVIAMARQVCPAWAAAGGRAALSAPGAGFAAAAAAIAAGNLVLGWGLGWTAAIRVFEGFPAMVPETAASLLFSAAGILLAGQRKTAPLLMACIFAILVIVANAFVRPLMARGMIAGDAMSVVTALSLILIAAGLGCRLAAARRRAMATQCCATAGFCLTLVTLTGYTFGAEALTGVPGFTEIALHTAGALALVFAALLALDRDAGWVGILTGQGKGSQVVRRIFPLLLVLQWISVLVAYLLATGGTVTVNFAVAAFASAMVVTIGAAGLVLAQVVNRYEERARRFEAELRRKVQAEHERELALGKIKGMEALAALVGGVAHDFNNTLAVIRGSLDLLALEEGSEAARGYVGMALAATEQGAGLTGQLLAYGRRSVLNPRASQLRPLVEETVEMFARVAPAGLAVASRSGKCDAAVEIDGGAFCQALLNLLVNARDATEGSGHVLLCCAQRQVGPGLARRFNGGAGMAPGRYLLVRVADDGAGMDAATLARATEPFFSTKEPGKGTGLGLASVIGFCSQSRGGLCITSRPGRGTVMTMAFPVAGRSAAARTVPGAEARAATAEALQILLVEDNAAVARLMADGLSRAGHRIRRVADAEAALDALAEGDLPDVLVTDVGLPGPLQGSALAALVAERHASVAVVIASGIPDDAARSLASSSAPVLLQKPVSLDRLHAAIAEALSRRAARSALRSPARGGTAPAPR
ncbi:response regulator [Poseidonocella sp. HB161398]|uniref:response regulator n=1 Tax=Poseidonocella sp. HB161398 TaxID=2320855 RepID=UPI001108F8A9|nr:response regulator [Poseidonocella sp. HB161398]